MTVADALARFKRFDLRHSCPKRKRRNKVGMEIFGGKQSMHYQPQLIEIAPPAITEKCRAVVKAFAFDMRSVLFEHADKGFKNLLLSACHGRRDDIGTGGM